ncbi:MAG TPA: gluconate 2-dehydrogenase subunit 3 family protein [Cyclobacteriaceae bacterium]|nr:gluconate 2-dehydrogenase subunit 3 family protein [Cyclobacteriaceae bacterium]
MNRREAIQRAGLVLGYAVSAPVLAGIMNGCKAAPELTYKPVFFNNDQAALVSEVAQVIIPKTDTPGAKEAGVPSFIDQLLRECYKKRDQQRFLESIKAFDEEAKKSMGDSFLDLEPAKQTELVTRINKEAVDRLKALGKIRKKLVGQVYVDPFMSEMHKEYGTPEAVAAADSTELVTYYRTGNFGFGVDRQTNKIKEVAAHPDAGHFVLTTKEFTVSGFFTSEIGATQVLQYEAVPGAYHGCVPLAEVGKTWATS